MVTFLSYVIHKGLRHHIFFIILDTSNIILLDPRISPLIDNQFPPLLTANGEMDEWVAERTQECSSHPCPMTREDEELGLDKEQEEKDVCHGESQGGRGSVLYSSLMEGTWC